MEWHSWISIFFLLGWIEVGVLCGWVGGQFKENEEEESAGSEERGDRSEERGEKSRWKVRLYDGG